jgi:hypothetical protein
MAPGPGSGGPGLHPHRLHERPARQAPGVAACQPVGRAAEGAAPGRDLGEPAVRACRVAGVDCEDAFALAQIEDVLGDLQQRARVRGRAT